VCSLATLNIVVNSKVAMHSRAIYENLVSFFAKFNVLSIFLSVKAMKT